MSTNSIFSFRRLLNLYRWHLVTGQKIYLLSLLVMFIAYFIGIFISMANNWNSPAHHIWQPLVFIQLGLTAIVISGNAFAFFRSREGIIDYNMVPASNSEKFVVEFTTKFLAVWLVAPIIFLLSANFSYLVVKIIFVRAQIDNFSPGYIFEGNKDMLRILFLSILFAQTIAFAGSTYFIKHPLVKTIAFTGMVFFTILSYFFVIAKVLEVRKPFIIKFINEENLFTVMFSLLMFSIVSALAYAFFKLKEKQIS